MVGRAMSPGTLESIVRWEQHRFDVIETVQRDREFRIVVRSSNTARKALVRDKHRIAEQFGTEIDSMSITPATTPSVAHSSTWHMQRHVRQ